MPKAFLLQYKKKQEKDVIYQEADTTADRNKMIKKALISDTQQNLSPETMEEEEEISVTDSEDSLEDDKYDHNDSGPDENEDNSDETESLEDDEEINEDEDDEEEEINIDENSDDDSEYMNRIIYPKECQSVYNDQPVVKLADTRNTEENLNGNELLERNLNHIGSKHSAFRKPDKELNININSVRNTTDNPFETISSSSGTHMGSFIDPTWPVSNYWYHMSRMYNNSIPWSPFHHPLALPGYNTLSGIHPEILHKQMLHHQMLYYGGQGMMPINHATHSMYTHPFIKPDTSILSNHNKRKLEQTEKRETPSIKAEITNRHPHQTLDNKNELSSLKNSSSLGFHSDALQNQVDYGATIPSHAGVSHINDNSFKFPLSSVSYPSTSSPTISPGTNATTKINTTPTTIPSPITPSSTSFGSTVPLIYNSMFGVRRPRDPNRPPAVKKYKCDLCPKAFSRSNTLVTHRRIHTGEKPFKCELCGRAFRQPGNLTRHRLTHTSVKPFVCVICKKAFNRASNLHTHMRTHTNFRSYQCPCCGKSFQQKVDLKIHMYTHGNTGH